MGSAAGEVTPSGRTEDVILVTESDSDEIRADIEATRADLSDTVDAIQAKLSPSNVQDTTEQITLQVKETAQDITEQAAEKFKKAALEVTEQATERVKETVTEIREQIKSDIHDATIGRVETMANNLREGARGAGSSLMTTIKENPIPAALVGFGLAWLFFSKSSGSQPSSSWREDQSYSYDQDRRYGYDYEQDRRQSGIRERAGYMASDVSQAASNVASGVSQKAESVADSVSEAAGEVKNKAGEFVNQAQERVGMVGQQIKGQSSQVVNKSQTILQENPLMAGAVALALGAAVGLMLPVTQQENQLMGEARDKFMDRAGGVVHETVDKAQHMVSEATQAAKESVKREAQGQGAPDNQQTPTP